MSDYCCKCKQHLSGCPTCKGKGMVLRSSTFTHSNEQCPNCNGTGKVCPKHGPDHG